MKITIIGPAYPIKGGLATFNERLARALKAAGHEVTLTTFTLQYPSFLYPGGTQFSSEPAPTDLDIRRLINSVNPLSWLRTGYLLRKEKYDLIIVRFWLPFMGPAFGTLLRIAKRGRKTRVLCIADNIIPHEKRFGDKPFTQYFLPAVDAFMCMSKQVLTDLQKLVPSKPSKFHTHPLYDNFGAPLSKEEARTKLQLPVAGRYVLFFGFIRKYKGLDILLEAMNNDAIKTKGIKLIIAGEYYEDGKYYEDLIEKWQLQDSVHAFTNFIPNEEVRYYFSAADLVVQPYRNATQSGITQVAYHFNKPMVVTNVGGLAENVPDGKVGYVVAPNAQSIAAGILKFYEEDAESYFTQQVAEEKKQYNWEAFVASMMQVVDSISNK